MHLLMIHLIILIKKSSINFLFFYWKYFIIFLGVKLRNKSYNMKSKKYIFNRKIK